MPQHRSLPAPWPWTSEMEITTSQSHCDNTGKPWAQGTREPLLLGSSQTQLWHCYRCFLPFWTRGAIELHQLKENCWERWLCDQQAATWQGKEKTGRPKWQILEREVLTQSHHLGGTEPGSPRTAELGIYKELETHELKVGRPRLCWAKLEELSPHTVWKPSIGSDAENSVCSISWWKFRRSLAKVCGKWC